MKQCTLSALGDMPPFVLTRVSRKAGKFPWVHFLHGGIFAVCVAQRRLTLNAFRSVSNERCRFDWLHLSSSCRKGRSDFSKQYTQKWEKMNQQSATREPNTKALELVRLTFGKHSLSPHYVLVPWRRHKSSYYLKGNYHVYLGVKKIRNFSITPYKAVVDTVICYTSAAKAMAGQYRTKWLISCVSTSMWNAMSQED